MDMKHFAMVRELRRRKWMYMARRHLLKPSLVKRLEEHPEQQQAALAQHCKKWPQQTATLEQSFAQCFVDRQLEQSEMPAVREDVFFCFFAYGFSVNEYLCYELRDKTPAERRAFLSDRDSAYIGYSVNDLTAMDMFDNKMKTYEAFAPYYKRKVIPLCGKADRERFLEFVRSCKVFVKKENFEACGRGVERIALSPSDSLPELFDRLIQNGDVLLEEVIAQDVATAVFNASSVNTIRIITWYAQDEVSCLYSFFKVGRAGAFVDNGGAGGILVGIDIQTGVLVTDGADELGNRYETHPDSGVKFRGHQLPQWDALLALCKEMSARCPKVRLIGWDMAYTPDGWVVVEGNAMTEVIGPQSTFQRGIRAELMGRLKL